MPELQFSESPENSHISLEQKFQALQTEYEYFKLVRSLSYGSQSLDPSYEPLVDYVRENDSLQRLLIKKMDASLDTRNLNGREPRIKAAGDIGVLLCKAGQTESAETWMDYLKPVNTETAWKSYSRIGASLIDTEEIPPETIKTWIQEMIDSNAEIALAPLVQRAIDQGATETVASFLPRLQKKDAWEAYSGITKELILQGNTTEADTWMATILTPRKWSLDKRWSQFAELASSRVKTGDVTRETAQNWMQVLKDAEAWKSYAAVGSDLIATGMTELSQGWMETAESTGTANGYEAYSLLAASLIRAGHDTNAIEWRNKLLAHGREEDYCRNIVPALIETGNTTEGLWWMDNFLPERHEWNLYSTIGASLITAGQTEHAEEWMRNLKQEEKWAEYSHLAQALVGSDKTEHAGEWITTLRAHALVPYNELCVTLMDHETVSNELMEDIRDHINIRTQTSPQILSRVVAYERQKLDAMSDTLQQITSTDYLNLMKQQFQQTDFPHPHTLLSILAKRPALSRLALTGPQRLYTEMVTQAFIPQTDPYDSESIATLFSHHKADSLLKLPLSPSLLLTKGVLEKYALQRPYSEVQASFIKLALNISQQTETVGPIDRRILYTLLQKNIIDARPLIKSFLAHPDVDRRIFSLFSRELIKENYFPDELKDFLDDPNLTAFAQKLLQTHPDVFQQAILTVASYDLPGAFQSEQMQQHFLQAINDMGSIGPHLFDLYLQAPDRAAFVTTIKTIKQHFFRNTPLSAIRGMIQLGTEAEKDDLLIELALVTYRPQDNTEGWVRERFNEIADDSYRSLERYTFPAEGYPVTLSSRTMGLRAEKQEKPFLFEQALHHSISATQAPQVLIQKVKEREEEIQNLPPTVPYSELLWRKEEQYQTIVGLLQQWNILPEWQELQGLSRYDQLSRLQKVLGKEHKDNTYTPGIDILDKFALILGDPEMETLIVNGYLRSQTQLLTRELKKYEEKATPGARVEHQFTSYMTHTKQSFLSRSRMGLCTDEDTDRYNQPDTWHLDTVDDITSTVEGNLICYHNTTESQLGGFLLIRQPNAIDLLDKGVSPASYCEEMLRVAATFAVANDIPYLAIPPNGDWHALSNDSRTQTYMEQTYATPKRLYRLSAPFPLATTGYTEHTIDEVYLITPKEILDKYNE